MNVATVSQDGVVEMVVTALRSVAPAGLRRHGAAPGEGTVLYGEKGILDSMGLVTLLVEVEQMVVDALDVDITIGDERALSRTRSPFRTVGSLADYVIELVRETTRSDVPA